MFRFSLRELSVLFAFVSVAFASLKFANDFWFMTVATVTMIVLFGSLIIATIDRGARQAFAIGFALTMIAYGAMLTTGHRIVGSGGSMNSKNVEFDQWAGRLPTTRLLRYVHMAVERNEWTDASGNVIPGYDPKKPVVPQISNRGPSSGSFGGPVGGAFFREVPPREIFVPIGHCWWSLLLGYVGGYFGRFVYWRRIGEDRKRPVDFS